MHRVVKDALRTSEAGTPPSCTSLGSSQDAGMWVLKALPPLPSFIITRGTLATHPLPPSARRPRQQQSLFLFYWRLRWHMTVHKMASEVGVGWRAAKNKLGWERKATRREREELAGSFSARLRGGGGHLSRWGWSPLPALTGELGQGVDARGWGLAPLSLQEKRGKPMFPCHEVWGRGRGAGEGTSQLEKLADT